MEAAGKTVEVVCKAVQVLGAAMEDVDIAGIAACDDIMLSLFTLLIMGSWTGLSGLG